MLFFNFGGQGTVSINKVICYRILCRRQKREGGKKRERERLREEWKEKGLPTGIFPNWLDTLIVIVYQARDLWVGTYFRIQKFYHLLPTFFSPIVSKLSVPKFVSLFEDTG